MDGTSHLSTLPQFVLPTNKDWCRHALRLRRRDLSRVHDAIRVFWELQKEREEDDDDDDDDDEVEDDDDDDPDEDEEDDDDDDEEYDDDD